MSDDVQDEIRSFAPAAELMPGVILIHDIQDFPRLKPVYITSTGLGGLGTSLEELSEMDINFHDKFFSDYDLTQILEKVNELVQSKDSSETLTFFQQLKMKGQKNSNWFVGSMRIFHQNDEGIPTHVVCGVFPVEQMRHIPNKAEKLIAENNFFRSNLEKFQSLGNRTREVLRLVALGRSSAEIAHELEISVDTVNTHRKNIKKKLNISTSYEFAEYAHAFDLI